MKRSSTIRKYVIFFLKATFTIAALAWLLHRIGVGTLIQSVYEVKGRTIIVAAALVALQAFMAAVRWQLILRYLGIVIVFVRSVQIYWIGMFGSALLPGGIAGDGLRIWVLVRSGIELSPSVNSVLLDRLTALAGLMLLVAIGLPYADNRVAPNYVRLTAAAILLVGLVAAIALGVWIRIPQHWLQFRVTRAVTALLADFQKLCKTFLHAFDLIGLSALSFIAGLFAIFFLLRSLGASVGIIETVTLGSLVILTATLPISLGGWGVREGAMIGLFGVVGVPATTSLAVSVVLGLLSTVVSLPGLLFWICWRHESTNAAMRPQALVSGRVKREPE
jgi:uncharacterized protein (TIRG00374 family)